MRKTAFAVALVSVGVVFAADAGVDDEHSTGAKIIPVHRYLLRDEADQSVLPTMDRSMPFSARTTCGPCHDYDKIVGGFHFNAAAAKAPGRPGQPWVWVDGPTGTQLPISYRRRAGAWKPGDIGLTAWRFTQIFGRHSPGAGVSEPPGDEAMFDPDARWLISGTLEANCLGCHSASKMYSHSEWAKQIGRDNFRWAATAASGLGDVGGMASKVPGEWLPTTDLHPDDTGYATPPAVRYDTSQFDFKHRAFIDVAKPQDKHCLYCHSVTEANKPKWQAAGDVHSNSGLKCVSCHRNGLDHRIIRGYASEAADRKTPAIGELSCQGCHLGAEGASGAAAMGGRLGAPRPRHPGLPAVHIEKIACTTCHSGPWPTDQPVRVWTSRANRMGIAGRARWRTDAPYIVEPVFIRDADGKIAPHRMMWPAYWGRLEGDKVTPLLPDDVAPATKGILDAEQQVGTMLGLLAPALIEDRQSAGEQEAKEKKIGGTPVFITGGKIYRANIDGDLKVAKYEGSMADVPVWWAREKDAEILPLIRYDYDRDGKQLPIGAGSLADDRIMDMIKSLNAARLGLGKAVLDTGDKVYQRIIEKFVDPQPDPETKKIRNVITYPFVLREVKGLNRAPGKPHTPTPAWLKDGQVMPLVPDFAVEAVVRTTGIEQSFTEAQGAMVLARLNAGGTRHVYVCSGKMFSLDGGMLVASDNPAAEAVAWPMAHDVRPAAQALGANGQCGDCHAWSSPILTMRLAAAGPMKTESGSVKSMYELADVSLIYHRMFGLTFTFRPIFKLVLIFTAGIIGVVLLVYGLRGVRRLARCAGPKE